jgi:hypothetical protein
MPVLDEVHEGEQNHRGEQQPRRRAGDAPIVPVRERGAAEHRHGRNDEHRRHPEALRHEFEHVVQGCEGQPGERPEKGNRAEPGELGGYGLPLGMREPRRDESAERDQTPAHEFAVRERHGRGDHVIADEIRDRGAELQQDTRPHGEPAILSQPHPQNGGAFERPRPRGPMPVERQRDRQRDERDAEREKRLREQSQLPALPDRLREQ